MSVELISIVFLFGLIALLVLGVPFAFASGALAALVALVQFGPDGMYVLASRTFDLVNSFSLTAVPMFVLMASILERSGIARDLYSALQFWVGRMTGGIAVATTIIAFILGATTGIVGGEIILLGLVALPQMLRLGYNRKLALGTICAGGSLATMVPPSIVLVFYGITAQASIGDLFLASATPALLLAAIYIAYIVIRCRLDPSLAPRPSAEQLGARPSGRQVVVGVGLPVFVALTVLGSIYLGLASITESAACGVAGVLICAALRRELSWGLIREALKQTMLTCGTVLWLVFGTNALIGVYNGVGGIAFAQKLLGGIAGDAWSLIAISMLVFLLLGFFIDWIGILFLTMPIFLPLVREYGIDPIWYGILFNMTVQVAYLSPPFAPAAFYLKSVAPADISLTEIFNACWPFIGLQLVGLAIVVAFPPIATWLPKLAN